MSSFGTVQDRRQGWKAGLGTTSPDFSQQVAALAQGAQHRGAAAISEWPAPEHHYVDALRRRMVRAVTVCILASVCATLAIVAMLLFAQSGWDVVHPWVSMMALVGSLGLLAIGLSILFTASKSSHQDI